MRKANNFLKNQKSLLLLIALFTITSSLLAQAPANDEPCNATIIPTPTDATCNYASYTTVGATRTTAVPAPSCITTQRPDVWFAVIVPAEGAVSISTQQGAGTMTNGVLSTYTGSCSALTQHDCNHPAAGGMPSLAATGLNPGDTLWIRMASFTGTRGSFDICVSLLPPPPSNDDACNAIPLTPDYTCNYQTFSNSYATLSPEPDPGCANLLGSDVWFSVTVPAEGVLTFDMQAGVMTDGGMAIYNGDCNNLNLLACDDNTGTGNMPQITQTGLTPGETIWVRIWENGNDNNGDFGICVKIPPPPPVNDDPCGAIEIIPDVSCNYQTFTNENSTATDPGVAPAPGCASYTGQDVWFKVVVPPSGALTFDSQSGAITDGGMAIYSGSCGALTLIACDDDAGTGLMPKIVNNNLTPGDTIWIRFWEYAGGTVGDFGLCVTLPPPPPSNDEPCGAISLTADYTCNAQTFSNDGATASTSVPDPGCAGYTGGDVWFNVVVPAEGILKFDTQADVMTDGGMAVYSGDCNNLNLLACDDNTGTGNMPQIVLQNLTPGETLWIRVWENGNNNNGNFGICVTIPPPPPANDEPCNAFEIIPDVTCNFQVYTNENATATPNVPAPGCANYAGGDVWFKVVVPPSGTLIFDGNNDQVILDGGMALYTGTCDNLSLLTCNDDASANGLMPKIVANNLNPGDTIWVRFWEYGGDNNGTFSLCVTLPPPPPANDEPCDAIELQAGNACVPQTFSNDGATGSTSVADPGCANYLGGDVWFKVVVPAGASTSSLLFDTQADIMTDGGMAIYTGTCDNLTLLACDDNSGAGSMPQINQAGLNPGDTVWIRVWEYGNDNNGNFGICVSLVPSPPVCGGNPPAGNSCDIATPVCNFSGYCGNTSADYTIDTWSELTTAFCGSIDNNSFISFVASDVSATFNVWVTNSRDGFGIQMLFYDGGCGSGAVNSYGCFNNDVLFPSALPHSVTATGLIPGQTYYLMFDGYAGDVCDYSIDPVSGVRILSVTTNPANSTICNGSTVTLSASGNAGTYSWVGSNLNSTTGNTVTASPTSTTVYTVTASDAVGNCPLTKDITVTVVNPNTGDTTATACSSFTWYGVTYTSTPVVAPTHTFTNSHGCDSVVTLHLRVSYPNTGDTTAVACNSFRWYGVTYNSTPVVAPTHTFRNVNGCDSVVTLHLTINQSTHNSSTQVACESYTWNGVVYTASGLYTYSYSNGSSCPSVDTLHLTINYGTHNTERQTACDSYLWHNTTYTTSGVYTYSYTNGNSCASVDTLYLTVGHSNTGDTTVTRCGTFTWYGSTYTSPTTATHTFKNLSGCDSIVTLHLNLPASPFTVDAGDPLTLVVGSNISAIAVVNPSASASSILWTPLSSYGTVMSPLVNTLTPSISQPSIVVSGNFTSLFEIKVTDNNGCFAKDTLVVNVQNECITVHNTFSPNGDGINDKWEVYASRSCLKNVSVMVYNRYGSKVYESRDYNNNWDGTYNGNTLPDATYYAIIEFETFSGTKTTVRTDVSIVR